MNSAPHLLPLFVLPPAEFCIVPSCRRCHSLSPPSVVGKQFQGTPSIFLSSLLPQQAIFHGITPSSSLSLSRVCVCVCALTPISILFLLLSLPPSLFLPWGDEGNLFLRLVVALLSQEQWWALAAPPRWQVREREGSALQGQPRKIQAREAIDWGNCNVVSQDFSAPRDFCPFLPPRPLLLFPFGCKASWVTEEGVCDGLCPRAFWVGGWEEGRKRTTFCSPIFFSPFPPYFLFLWVSPGGVGGHQTTWVNKRRGEGESEARNGNETNWPEKRRIEGESAV